VKKHKLRLNGKEVTEAEFHRDGPIGSPGVPMITSTYTDAKPLISEGLGCMKHQVPEMREAIKKRNIQGVRVLDTGQLEITSRRGRREVGQMRPIPLVDADGGYGD
jgi:hypothetical protein